MMNRTNYPWLSGTLVCSSIFWLFFFSPGHIYYRGCQNRNFQEIPGKHLPLGCWAKYCIACGVLCNNKPWWSNAYINKSLQFWRSNIAVPCPPHSVPHTNTYPPYLCGCMHAHSFSHVWLFATLWTVAHPGSSVHGILQARIRYWSGLPCPPPGNLPIPGSNLHLPVSSALQADSLPTEPPGKPLFMGGKL